VREMLDDVDQLPHDQKTAVIDGMVNSKDLNLRSVFQKCLEQGYDISFKVIFDKFMSIHGSLKTYEDQIAIKGMQRLLNEMVPFLLSNHEIFNYVIN